MKEPEITEEQLAENDKYLERLRREIQAAIDRAKASGQ